MSDEETVRTLDDQERSAALARDVAALDQLWSDEFTINAPNSQVVAGKKAVFDTFMRTGIIDFASFDRAIEFCGVDGGFAILMGLETLVANRSAPGVGLVAGRPVQRRFTNIWRKEAVGWRLFARHANVVIRR